MATSARSPAVMPVLALLPLILSAAGVKPAQRALQAQAITDENLAAAVAQCLAESADGDCPNSSYGNLPDWDTSSVTNMNGSALCCRISPSFLAPVFRTKTPSAHIVVRLACRSQCS